MEVLQKEIAARRAAESRNAIRLDNERLFMRILKWALWVTLSIMLIAIIPIIIKTRQKMKEDTAIYLEFATEQGTPRCTIDLPLEKNLKIAVDSARMLVAANTVDPNTPGLVDFRAVYTAITDECAAIANTQGTAEKSSKRTP